MSRLTGTGDAPTDALVAARFNSYWLGQEAQGVVDGVRNGHVDPILARYARGAESIAELGCGTAVQLFHLARAAPRRRAIGYDVAPGSVALCENAEKALGTGARFEVADIRELPAEDEAFDLVYSYGVLEHFKDPERVLAEQMRVLRPGGHAFVEVPHTLSTYAAYKSALVAAGRWKFGWETSYTKGRLSRMMRDSGLEIVDSARRETYLLARAANTVRYHADRRLNGSARLVKRAVDAVERYAPVPRWRSLTVVGRKP